MAKELQKIAVWPKDIEFGTAFIDGAPHLYARAAGPESGYDVHIFLTEDAIRRLVPQLEAMRGDIAGRA